MTTNIQQQEIIKELRKSDTSNTVDMFWDNIMEYNNKNILSNAAFSQYHKDINACIYRPKPFINLFDRFTAIDIPTMQFQICAKDHVAFVRDDLINFFFNKIATYAVNHKSLTKYYITGIIMACDDNKSGHFISIVISSEDKTITIFEPNSAKEASPDRSKMLTNLHLLYDQLDKKHVIVNNNNTFTVYCPRFDDYNIQRELSISSSTIASEQRRSGSCSVIGILIAHIMIYTKGAPDKVLSEIQKTITAKRKELENAPLIFADSYMQFLIDTMNQPSSPSISAKTEKEDAEIKLEFNNATLLRGLVKHLQHYSQISKKTADFINKLTVPNQVNEFYTKGFVSKDNLITACAPADIDRITPILADTSNKELIDEAINLMGAVLIEDSNSYSLPVSCLLGTVIKRLHSKLSYQYRDTIFLFNIFIDNSGVISIEDTNYNIRLILENDGNNTPVIRIEMYYANKKDDGSLNLNVLREMLQNFKSVSISNTCRVKCDDNRTIPYRLWSFVKYSKSQFYKEPTEEDEGRGIIFDETPENQRFETFYDIYVEFSTGKLFELVTNLRNKYKYDLQNKQNVDIKKRVCISREKYTALTDHINRINSNSEELHQLNNEYQLDDFANILFSKCDEVVGGKARKLIETEKHKAKEKAKKLKDKEKAKKVKDKEKAKKLKEKEKAKKLKEKDKASALS